MGNDFYPDNDMNDNDMMKTETEWNCVSCTFLNASNRRDCEMCGTKKTHCLPSKESRSNKQFFLTEVSNKLISNNGMIREIKIIDQFENKQLKELINAFNTCSAICGYLSCAIPRYLLSNHQFPFHPMFRNISKNNNNDIIINSDESKQENGNNNNNKNNILNDIICKQLCNANQLSSYIAEAMEFIQQDRIKYIKNNPHKFKNDNESKNYLKAWIANYEISRYIESMDCKYKKFIVFLRCNQYRELDISNREEEDLIIKEEKPFGLDVRFLIEFFEPRELIQCHDNNNYKEFIEKCKKRDIQNVKSLLWILDLHGHYNCAFSINIEDKENKTNENNLIIMDTYLANHCENPAVAQCFDLVFNSD